jgi:rRNA maturation protein Nop10
MPRKPKREHIQPGRDYPAPWRKRSTPAIPGFPIFDFYAQDCPDCGERGFPDAGPGGPYPWPGVDLKTGGRCPTCGGAGMICPPDQESPAEYIMRKRRQ